MARYIDADALKLDIDLSKGASVLDMAIGVIKAVQDAPTADVVEVVRCVDCVSGRSLYINDSWETTHTDEDGIYCMYHDIGMKKDGFCSCGAARACDNGNNKRTD